MAVNLICLKEELRLQQALTSRERVEGKKGAKTGGIRGDNWIRASRGKESLELSVFVRLATFSKQEITMLNSSLKK